MNIYLPNINVTFLLCKSLNLKKIKEVKFEIITLYLRIESN